jgi:hypothetical protein
MDCIKRLSVRNASVRDVSVLNAAANMFERNSVKDVLARNVFRYEAVTA